MSFNLRGTFLAVCAALLSIAMAVPGPANSATTSCSASTAPVPSSSRTTTPTARLSSLLAGNLAVKPIGKRSRRVCMKSNGAATFANASVKFRIRNTGHKVMRLSRLKVRVSRGMKPVVALKLGRHRLPAGIAGGSFVPKPPCMLRVTHTELKFTCKLKKSRVLKPGNSIKLKVKISATAPAVKQYVKLSVAGSPVARESSLRDNKARVKLKVLSADGSVPAGPSPRR